MAESRSKKMPKREVCFTDIKLVGHRAISAKICYTIETDKRTTWINQPIEFTFCDAMHLARKFHAMAKELEKQLDDFKTAVHGGKIV